MTERYSDKSSEYSKFNSEQPPASQAATDCQLSTANLFPSPANRKLSTANGFTLIELIMTIIILGFTSLIMIPFVTSIAKSPDPVIRQRAISLGQALLDEILAKKWDENSPMGGGPICTVSESGSGRGTPSYILACPEPVLNASPIGPDGGETRVDYDDVDDYNGLTATDNFVDQSNSPFSLSGYSRSATVTYIASNSDPITAITPAASINTTDTKRIVVTVTSPRNENFYLVALKCNY